MQTKQFGAFLAQAEQLTPQQRKQTLEHIQKRCDIDTVETVLDSGRGLSSLWQYGSLQMGY